MTILYITGESAQGKTPIALELSESYRWPVIHTDGLYQDPHNLRPKECWVGMDHEYKKTWYREQAMKCKDIVIIEGCHVGSKKERELINEYINCTQSYLLKLDVPGLDIRIQGKYHTDRQDICDWFNKIYEPDKHTTTVKSYDDIIWFIEKNITGIYVYQDHINLKQKFKNLDFNWNGKSIIEAGCNIGKLGKLTRSWGASDYMGFDIDKNMIKVGKERYPGFELYHGEILDFMDYERDVYVAMAVFHHIQDDEFITFLQGCKCKELVFEVPVGDNTNYEKYTLRSENNYIELINKCYGRVVDIVDSGATNDQENKRRIFICKKR